MKDSDLNKQYISIHSTLLFIIITLLYNSVPIAQTLQLTKEENFFDGYKALSINSTLKKSSLLELKISADNKLSNLVYPDSIYSQYITWEDKRLFWFSALELTVIEFIPWALARWVRTWEDPEDNWAKATPETIWRNITYGWEYDGDNFLTNNFSHPYHGNLYYNVGRTNGYDFWESSVWAFAGSALWEFFAETYRPAINDWVNTSVNGINLGEMLYRLSSVITDNTASGSKRVFQEIGGAVLNPVRGINRLISGETSRIFPNKEESYPTSFTVVLDAGARRWIKDGSDDLNEAFIAASLHYGNIFTSNIRQPFSSFNVSAVFATSSPSLTNLQSFGNLYGWNLFKGNEARHRLLISLNYNYFNNPSFIYGGTSITSHLVSTFKAGKKTNFFTNAGLDIILMGATPTDYYEDVEGRNYDFGPGLGVNLGASVNKGVWSIVRVFYSSKWIWTQSEPSDSKHHLHLAWLDFELPLLESYALSLGFGAYWRNSIYKYNPDINKTTPVVRLSVKAVL